METTLIFWLFDKLINECLKIDTKAVETDYKSPCDLRMRPKGIHLQGIKFPFLQQIVWGLIFIVNFISLSFAPWSTGGCQ